MTVTLVTVPNVPIVSTGTYQLASGETTFSAEDLADAVLAAQDPTVPAARLKLGHTDARFDEAIASGELDGEPAFGTVQNLRLSADGQTVLGDYCDVPEWLAEMLPSSYPGRSIEGGFGYTAPSGRSYKLVIARVALLGITWPGVTSLADLREVLEQNGELQDDGAVEARSDSFVVARVARTADPTDAIQQTAGAHGGGRVDDQNGAPATDRRRGHDLLAGMDLGSVRMQFCGDLDTGEVPNVPEGQPQADDVGPQYCWWPRSVRVEDDGSLCLIVDDDEGHLIRIPFTVQQGDLLYGSPELVIEQYVPVTSDPDDGQAVAARGPRTLASWPVRAANRPDQSTQESHTMRINGSDVDSAALRQRLGLAEDADDAAIYDALGIPAESETAETTSEAAPAEPVAASSGATLPAGMVAIDEATLAELRSGAQAGRDVSARLATEDRDRVITAAISAGKIPPSRRGHYEAAWAQDADGTRVLLTASVADGGLAEGLVPTGARETGRAGDGETDPAAADQAHDAFMARHFPQATARLRGKTGGRVRQEA